MNETIVQQILARYPKDNYQAIDRSQAYVDVNQLAKIVHEETQQLSGRLENVQIQYRQLWTRYRELHAVASGQAQLIQKLQELLQSHPDITDATRYQWEKQTRLVLGLREE